MIVFFFFFLKYWFYLRGKAINPILRDFALIRRIHPTKAGRFTSQKCHLFIDWPLNIPIGSMYAIYMVTFAINIPPMLVYIPYMDPMGYEI